MKLLKLKLHSLDILFWTKYQHTHTHKKPTWSVFFSLSWAFALASAHAAILNLCRAKKKKVVWLSFSISLYVLLIKWNEQTHCPNMLHHTERVGLSYRINKGRKGGIGSPLE